MDFTEIPDPNLSPLVAAELDPLGAPGEDVHTILVVGYRLGSATVPALTPTLTSAEPEADAQHGEGSQLARMLRAVKRVNTRSRCFGIGVGAPSGTAAAGTLTFTGPASEAGAFALYVAGERVPVAIASGDSAAAVATKVAAAINADGQLPVTAAAESAVVTVTCRWNGLSGNAIDLAVNLRPSDRSVAGVGLTIGTWEGGTGSPDLAAVVAVLEERRYDAIVLGDHGANLGDMVDEVSRRWRATIQLDGHVWIAARGSLGALSSLGGTLNAPELTVLGLGASPSAPWIAAAQAAGVDGTYTSPARPRGGAVLPDVVAPLPAARFDHDERNLLLLDGISTLRIDAGGRSLIDRLVTTYKTNAFGAIDRSWQSLMTRHTAAFLRRDWVAYLQTTYPGYLLGDDDTIVDPGVRLVTPSVLRGEALAWFQRMQRRGLVEDFAQFRETLAALRPAGDPTRVDMLVEPNLTNELVTIATKFAFRT